MKYLIKIQSKMISILRNDNAVSSTVETAFLLFIGVLVAVAIYMLAVYVADSGTNVGSKIVGAFSDASS